jgi:hypothetical protein
MTAERVFWTTFDNSNQSYTQVVYGIFDIYVWSCTQATFEPNESRDQNDGDISGGRDENADGNHNNARDDEGNINQEMEEGEQIPASSNKIRMK